MSAHRGFDGCRLWGGLQRRDRRADLVPRPRANDLGGRRLGKVSFTDFTRERKEVEPGDYYADISKIKRTTGWRPKTSLEEGIRRTADFYRTHQKEYWV